MLYFSQLQGKRVLTTDQKVLGKVRDIIFLAADSPLVTKVQVRDENKRSILVPISAISEINSIVQVDKDYKPEELAENELSVTKNLLDKQIIDMKGGKVVRVNDVAIQAKENREENTEKQEFYVTGVDVGFRAVLRWLHLERPAMPLYRMLGLYSRPHFLSWADIEPLELAHGNVRLKKDMESLERMRPEDLADYLEKTNIRNVNKIVSELDDEFAADVIGDLNISYQTSLFRRFSPEKAATLLDFIDSDEAVDILLTLSEEKRDEILKLLPKAKHDELHHLMKLSKTPIGELINPDFITVSADDTIGTAFSKIKEKITEDNFFVYIYVVNKEDQLIGVFRINQLLTQPSDAAVWDVMEQDVVVLHLTTPKEIAVKKMLRYKLYALPVIDDRKQILGVVMFDDMVEDILEKI